MRVNIQHVLLLDIEMGTGRGRKGGVTVTIGLVVHAAGKNVLHFICELIPLQLMVWR